MLKQGVNKPYKYKSRKAGTTSIGKRDIKNSLNAPESAIQDLLKQKGVSHTTLIKNIQILCEKDETIDLSKFRPSDEVLSVVANTIKSYRSRGASQPLYKNNAMFIMQNVKMNGGSDLSEVDVWKSFLFLTDMGEIR